MKNSFLAGFESEIQKLAIKGPSLSRTSHAVTKGVPARKKKLYRDTAAERVREFRKKWGAKESHKMLGSAREMAARMEKSMGRYLK